MRYPSTDEEPVSFEPHPWLPGGHAQSVAGRYLPGTRGRLDSTYHEIQLEDGDRICGFESVPTGWRPGDPAALLVHGLAGCAGSPYVRRVGARLVARGIRLLRLNLRNAGAGFGLARGIYHAGRSGDVRAAAGWLASRASGSPIAIVGFSLGGNLVLKLAAEAAGEPLAGLDAVVAANPPLDLAASCAFLRRPAGRLYDRNFVRLLRLEIGRLHTRFPDLGPANLAGVGSVYDFDDRYTAPRNGFASASDYYARSSAGPLVGRIRVAGLVVHAEDDPFIPPEPFRAAAFPPRVKAELLPHGGHLGYVARAAPGRGRRWLDARIESWLCQHWREWLRATRGEEPASEGGRVGRLHA
jgi:predicted alpha/beta-fold hydrolase